MQPFQIISDSACDISLSQLEALQVEIVPFSVSFDTEIYYKELSELTTDVFYKTIKESHVFPKTSLPSISDYTDKFEPILKMGKDILCFCLSSKFSGSYQSAVNAKASLSELYPQRQIIIIDSISATGGQGLLVKEAARMRDMGIPFSQLIEQLEQVKNTSKINFTVDSLEHLQKGGRIGRAAALAGTILNIKPIIVLTEGELHPQGKIRGHKKALAHLIAMTEKEIGNQKDKYRVLLVRAEKEREEAALEVANELREKGFQVDEEISVVGITVGTHAGPTAIGICYIKKFEFM